MKAVRVLLALVVVLAAGFLAFRGCRGVAKSEKEPAPVAPPAQGTDPAPFPTLLGDPPKDESPKPPRVETPPPVVPDVEPPAGTPVKDGAEVSLVVPYRTGTKNRYRVREAQLSRDRDTGAVQWWQFVWIVGAQVVKGDGTGPARIKFEIESFRFQTDSVEGPVDIDSGKLDDALLAKEKLGLGRTIRPLVSILRMPVELVIGAGDEITGVEGVDALSRTFLDAVDAIGSKYVKDAIDAPTAESITQKWSEALFPPLGGGTLKAGATRDLVLRTTYLERWSNFNAGKLRVTEDDPDVFRVEFKGKPEMEELNRPAKSPSALGVEKCRIVSSADAYAASWRFDRATGRLLWGRLSSKFRFDISRRNGVGANGAPIFEPRFTDIERRLEVELLDK